jgi:hypothetical protein
MDGKCDFRKNCARNFNLEYIVVSKAMERCMKGILEGKRCQGKRPQDMGPLLRSSEEGKPDRKLSQWDKGNPQ